MRVTPSVARAMSAQLDRVNAQADLEVERRGVALEALHISERHRAAALERIQTLEALVASLQEQLRGCRGMDPQAQLFINGRPVLTQAQAAERAGRSVATVSRYCASGYWEAVRASGSRWLIYADQPLTPRRRR